MIMKNYWFKFIGMCFLVLISLFLCTYFDCKIWIEYWLHNYGDFSSLGRCFLGLIPFMLTPLVIGGSLNLYYEKKYGEGFKSNHTNLFYIIYILIFVHIKIGNNYIDTIKEDALKNSYYSFGRVYGMHPDIKGMPYSVWTGMSEDKTMRNSNVGAKIFNKLKVGDTVLVQVSLKYPVMHKVINWFPKSSDFELYSKPDNQLVVKDLSSLDGDSLCNKFGVYLVYKATRDSLLSNDSIVLLTFNDINMRRNKVKYKLPQKNDLDTFLVYQNVNNQIDNRLIVCAPEINTPENWSKISDYGYIFHYDIYRKEEIETQCPQIKNYVEKFKERNINNENY